MTTINKTRVPVLAVALGLLATSDAHSAQDCDNACLIELADGYMAAQMSGEYTSLPWSDEVRFTENDVAMMIGDGLWGTLTSMTPTPFKLADAKTGNVLWFGTVEEHGLAAYFGLRIKAENGRISEVDTLLGREGTPAWFEPPTDVSLHASFGQELASSLQLPRKRLIELVDRYYDSMEEENGKVLTSFHPDCEWISNGYSVTNDGGNEQTNCQSQFENGMFQPIEHVRSRRYPIVCETLGIVVAQVRLDRPARFVNYQTRDGKERRVRVEYPNSLSLLEFFKVSEKGIFRVEGLAVFQPYRMPVSWSATAHD